MNFLFDYIINAIIAFNASALYIPQCTNFPMLTNENEISVDVGFKLFEAHASAAYALTDDLLVQIDADAGALFHNDRTYGQAAAGWYKNMGNHAVVEVLGGASIGMSTYNRINGSGDFYRGQYSTLFLQGDYGWTNVANSHIDIAFGVKCGLLNCHIEGNDDNSQPHTGHYASLFAEPNICFRFGWEKFKFNIISGYNFHRPSESFKQVMSNELSTNISLNYHFTPKKKATANATTALL